MGNMLRLCAVVLFTLIVVGCGGADVVPAGSGNAPDQQPPIGESGKNDPNPFGAVDVDFLNLDEKVATELGDSPEADGSDFIENLGYMGVVASAPTATFSGDLSYAIYALRQENPEDWMAVYLEWTVANDEADVWIGLSNYHKLAWEWFQPDNWYHMVTFDNSDHFRSGNGITYVVVVILNADETLRKISIDRSYGIGGDNIGMPWGSTIGTISGRGIWSYDTEVWAKSNLGNPWPTPTYSEGGHTSGYKWQCVESCERFVWRIWNIDTPPMSSIPASGNGLSYGAWKWFYQNLQGGMTRHYNGSSTIPPRLGDVVVWSAPRANSAGHVAVVKHVDLEAANPYIAVIQQNVFNGLWDAWYIVALEKNGSTYRLRKPTSGVRSEILGWIHYGTFTLEGQGQVDAPTGLTATSYAGMVRLQWDVKTDVDSYSLARDGVPIGYPEGHYWYHEDQVPGAGPYEYSLVAWRNGQASPPAYVTGSPLGQPPSMPTGVTASQATYPNGILVEWEAVPNADAYNIYCNGDTSPKFTEIPTTFRFDNDADSGAPYFYQVQAVNSSGSSQKSGNAYGWAGKDPIASLAGTSPTSGTAPLQVNFNGSSSADQDGYGAITKYEWDWTNDGTYDLDSGTDATRSHTYDTPGSYTAKLRVTDDDLPAGTATVTIGITVNAGTYRASGRVTETDGSTGIDNVNIAFSNGIASVSTDGAGNWTQNGFTTGTTYTVTPTLEEWSFDPTDEDFSSSGGNVTGLNFTGYTDPIADISASPESGPAPLTVEFDASGSEDPDGGSITKYEWDWTNDGSWDFDSGTDPAPSHEYTSEGTYTAAVRVTDDENETDTATIVIDVSPPAEEWAHSWGGSSEDRFNAISHGPSNSSYAVGVTDSFDTGNNDVVLRKYDSTGIIQWSKVWGGDATDRGEACTVDASGNLYVVGRTDSFGAGNYDVFILKTNSSGSLLWKKTWGGANWDMAFGIAVNSTGDLLVAGFTRSYGQGNSDALVMKYNSSGSLIWVHTWGGADGEEAKSIAVDSTNNVYVTGSTYSFGGNSEAFLLKYNSSGSLQWRRTWGGAAQDEGHALYIDSADNVYLVGETNSYGAGSFDFLLLKYNSAGSVLWAKTWGGVGWDEARSVSVNGNEVFITGETYSFGTGEGDIPLLVFNTSGLLVSDDAWGGGAEDGANGIFIGTTGLVHLVGLAPRTINGDSTPYGSWFDLTGASVSSPSGNTTNSGGIETDPNGTITSPSGNDTDPSGTTNTGGGNNDCVIVCYNPNP